MIWGSGFREGASYRARAAILRAGAGDGQQARARFRDILRSGKLRDVLQLQVRLRNNGFGSVVIDGKVTPALEAAIDRCLELDDCREAIGQPI